MNAINSSGEQYPLLRKAIQNELYDLDVVEVSLVRKPANGRRFAILKTEAPFWRSDDEVEKGFGSGSVVGSTRFPSGPHYEPAPTPPTRTRRKQKDKASVEALAQQLLQAFLDLMDKNEEFRRKLVKNHSAEGSEDNNDQPTTYELIEKAIEETPSELPYDLRLQMVFRENPDLEALWFRQE